MPGLLLLSSIKGRCATRAAGCAGSVRGTGGGGGGGGSGAGGAGGRVARRWRWPQCAARGRPVKAAAVKRRGGKKAGAVKGRHGAEARIPSHGRMAVRGRHGAEARTPLARSRGGMAGPRRSARLARRHPRRSERIAGRHTASVRQKPSFKPRPPPAPGWLGRGWYRAEIVGHRGPPWQYRVKWTGWKKTSWVDAADVTPLAINAYRQQPPPPPTATHETPGAGIPYGCRTSALEDDCIRCVASFLIVSLCHASGARCREWR